MTTNITSYKTLDHFLREHVIEKGSNKVITHTEFGRFSKRSFHIQEEHETLFEDLYYNDIILKNKTHNIMGFGE